MLWEKQLRATYAGNFWTRACELHRTPRRRHAYGRNRRHLRCSRLNVVRGCYSQAHVACTRSVSLNEAWTRGIFSQSAGLQYYDCETALVAEGVGSVRPRPILTSGILGQASLEHLLVEVLFNHAATRLNRPTSVKGVERSWVTATLTVSRRVSWHRFQAV